MSAYLHAKRCAGVPCNHPYHSCSPRGLPHSQGCRVRIPSLIRGTTSAVASPLALNGQSPGPSGHLTSEHLPALIESSLDSTHLRYQISASLASRKAPTLAMDHAAAEKFVRPHRYVMLTGEREGVSSSAQRLGKQREGNHMIIIVHHPPSWSW